MNAASALRAKIEAALADRIPSALTPAPRLIRPAAPTGISSVDTLLEGGLPLGAITEVVGPECSGRTSLALSFVAQMTQSCKVCAWIDVSDTFDPESAASIGVELSRLLWVRCGVSASTATRQSQGNNFTLPDKYLVPRPEIKGLHGGGCGPHPRGEVKGLSDAVGGFLRPDITAPQCAQSLPKARKEKDPFKPAHCNASSQIEKRFTGFAGRSSHSNKPWSRIDQALRVTDLLLQAGGFSAIVMDMGSIAPEHASRVPLATWFRYRAAAERSQSSILLLTQHSCARSSAELLLRMQPGRALLEETTLFTGIEHHVEVIRERFKPELCKPAQANLIPLRKPLQKESGTHWRSRTTWSGRTGIR
jgi:hypothetical protein